MTADELARKFGAEAANELDSALRRIKHCLGQLNDEQIWRRASPAMNSMGNVILHLCGNLRQWMVAGLGVGRDSRNRPAEFTERGPITKPDLLGRLESAVNDSKSAIQKQSARDLVANRRIQGEELSGLAAIFNSVPHFRGHTQEIVYMTRILLSDAYVFAWTPSTVEEGAPGPK